MRPHEETQPPDPLRGFRTFVVVVIVALPCAVIGHHLASSQATGNPAEALWILVVAALPLWFYHQAVISPAGSVAVGLLILSMALAIPLLHLLGAGSGATALVMLGLLMGPFWLVLLLAFATEVLWLYPSYWERWQLRLRFEEAEEVGRGIDG